MELIAVVSLGFLFGVLCLFGSFREARRWRLLDGLPTSKTTGVFIGLVELEGEAECGQPLVSYLAEEASVYYSWAVSEKWERTIVETTTDSQGKQQTRTRKESGWKKVAGGTEMVPFYLRDECGAVLVRPEGAEVQATSVFSQECGPSDPLYYGKCGSPAIADSVGRRQFSEEAIRLQERVFLVGQAREREDIVAPEIAKDSHAPVFLIGTKREKAVVFGMKWRRNGWVFLGLVLSVAPLFFLGNSLGFSAAQTWGLCGGGALVYLGFWGISWVWVVYNSLVDLRQRVRQGWAQIDVLLKRRFDLVPNLVQVVKGYAGHEGEAQCELAGLRAAGAGSDFYAPAAGRLVAVAESYPELKANEMFLKLQKELADTEDRIGLARGYYNEIATHFNTRKQVFPDSMVAGMAGMRDFSFWEQ